MNVQKGQPGYITSQKRKSGLQTFIGFGIVGVLLIIGYMQTGTRLNLLTMVAVLGCLPAAKVLVGLIMLLPYPSISKEKALEIEEQSRLLTTAYDMIITSREKIMPVDAIVISGTTVCGYSSHPKTNEAEAAKHIKNVLEENRLLQITVKLFPDYTAFLARAEGLNNIAEIEQPESKELEAQIRQIILNISM